MIGIVGIVQPAAGDSGVFVVDANGTKSSKGRGDSIGDVGCSRNYSE